MHPVIFEIAYAILRKQAVRIEYQSPYTSKQVFFGVFTDTKNDFKKTRFTFYDQNTLKPILDDFNKPQTLTVLLENILSIKRYPQFTYTIEQACFESAHRSFLKLRMNETFQTYFELGDEYNYKSLKFKEMDTFDLQHAIPFETILSIKDESRKTPLMSYRLAFDIETQTFRRQEKVWHKMPLENYFKAFPLVDIEFITAEFCRKYLNEGYFIEEQPYLFEIKKTLEETRKNLFFQHDLNRPMRAYLQQLGLRNLGRKPYILPHFDNELRVKENLLAYTSLKHPVTLVDVDRFTNTQHYLKHLIESSVLNHQTMIVLDNQGLKDSFQAPIIDLRNQENFNNSMEHVLKLFDERLTVLENKIPAIDYETIYQNIQKLEAWKASVSMMRHQRYHFKSTQDFHLSVAIETALNSLYQKCPSIDLALFNEAILTKEEYTKHLKNRYSLNLQKLKLKAFKQLLDIIRLKDYDLRYKMFLKVIKKPVFFHQIKQIFRIIVVNETKQLPYIFNAVEQLVLISPQQNHLKDLYYADKLTIFDDRFARYQYPFCKSDLPIGAIYQKFSGKPYEVFNSLSNELVKKHQYRTLGLKTQELFDVELIEENDKHQSVKETEEVMRYLSDSSDSNVHIFTPFNEQKRALKKQKRFLVETFYQRPQRDQVIFSLALHNNTPQETYDWVKNHPELEPLLKSLEGLNTIVFTNYEAILRHATHQDLLMDFIHSIKIQSTTALDNMRDFYKQITNHILKGYRIARIQSRDLKELRLPSTVKLYDAFSIAKLDQQFIIVIVPNHWTLEQFEHLKKRLREDHYEIYMMMKSDSEDYRLWRKNMFNTTLIYEDKRSHQDEN